MVDLCFLKYYVIFYYLLDRVCLFSFLVAVLFRCFSTFYTDWAWLEINPVHLTEAVPCALESWQFDCNELFAPECASPTHPCFVGIRFCIVHEK